MERRRIDMQDDFLKSVQAVLPDIADCIRKRVPQLPARELVWFWVAGREYRKQATACTL